MSAIQTIVYRTRSLTSTHAGRTVHRCVKWLAGLYFDLALGCRYRTDGMTFEIPKDQTTREMRGRFAVDTYELPERRLVKEHLPRSATVLEMGGCIGVVSCTINRNLDNPEKHLVLEANPHLIPALQKNRAINHCSFVIKNAVISALPSVRISTGKIMDSNTLAGLSEDGGETIDVTSTSVSEMQQEMNCVFDAIVMDIEGAEYDFMKENEQLLPQIDALMVEMHPHLLRPDKINEMHEMLMGAGMVEVDEMLTVEFWHRPR
jgi:FkbM family methyltransferase